MGCEVPSVCKLEIELVELEVGRVVTVSKEGRGGKAVTGPDTETKSGDVFADEERSTGGDIAEWADPFFFIFNIPPIPVREADDAAPLAPVAPPEPVGEFDEFDEFDTEVGRVVAGASEERLPLNELR